MGHGNGSAEWTFVRIRGQSPEASRFEASNDGGGNFRHVQSLLHRLQSRSWFIAALHKNRQERRRDHGQHLPVLRVTQHTERTRLSRSYSALRGKEQFIEKNTRKSRHSYAMSFVICRRER